MTTISLLIPDRFGYLNCKILENRSGELRVKTFDSQLERHVGLDEKLNPEEVAELAGVFQEILSREDNLAILEWCESLSSERQPVNSGIHRIRSAVVNTARMLFGRSNDQQKHDQQCNSTVWNVIGLLLLMRELGESGVEPFNTRLIVIELPRPKSKWQKLPENLECLAPIFDRYSEHFSEDRIDRWLRKASRTQRQQLRNDAHVLFQLDDQIEPWYQGNFETDEARAIYWMHIFFMTAGITEEK